jgi:hypothetical protein
MRIMNVFRSCKIRPVAQKAPEAGEQPQPPVEIPRELARPPTAGIRPDVHVPKDVNGLSRDINCPSRDDQARQYPLVCRSNLEKCVLVANARRLKQNNEMSDHPLKVNTWFEDPDDTVV